MSPSDLSFYTSHVAEPPTDITDLLLRWNSGDKSAFDHITTVVYDELRRLASALLTRERAGHTLSATALVHEAYLRLVDQNRVQWQNRAHFFAISARLMRRILVDHARQRGAAKRGGGNKVALEDAGVLAAQPELDVLALNQALEKLARLDPQQGRIVELRFFGGLTEEEIADILGVAPITVKREWAAAKAWLKQELSTS